MDYETFGEHNGHPLVFLILCVIFRCSVIQVSSWFCQSKDVSRLANYQQESLSFPEPVSWADEQEIFLLGWVMKCNKMQVKHFMN